MSRSLYFLASYSLAVALPLALVRNTAFGFIACLVLPILWPTVNFVGGKRPLHGLVPQGATSRLQILGLIVIVGIWVFATVTTTSSLLPVPQTIVRSASATLLTFAVLILLRCREGHSNSRKLCFVSDAFLMCGFCLFSLSLDMS
ncbi:hypothetical protein Q31a_13870 [Aureliella helgolandensis]|uniref:Uncharacterized protein n=1 Tax=Aureliella helgolandensis TaxID=2527968 RepID=A0A518G3C7_9BACT|nr:hypothetical protein Q31a_13870 [Aureliella helgolandensis]